MLSRDEVRTKITRRLEAGIYSQAPIFDIADAIMALYDAAIGREWTACAKAMPKGHDHPPTTEPVECAYVVGSGLYEWRLLWWQPCTQTWIGPNGEHYGAHLVTHWREWHGWPAPPVGKEVEDE